MHPLSLNLRGLASTQTLASDATTRGASASVLAHGIGVVALILFPLLRSSDLPKLAGPSPEVLIQPIRVALAPAPIDRSFAHTRATPGRPQPVFAAPVTPTTNDRPLVMMVGDVLDPAMSHTGIETGDGKGVGGDCPLGSLCGGPELPVAALTPVEVPHIGPSIKEPRLLESRSPMYPPLAQAAGVAGRVVLEVHYGHDGRIRDAQVLESHRLFDEAALASVRSRRYEPLLLNGVPTDFMITITIVFNLRR